MIPPYGALPGFSMDREIRFIAAHYEMQPRALKYTDGRGNQRHAEARAALCWRCVCELGMPPARVAEKLNVTTRAVEMAVAAHKQRILEFARDVMLSPEAK